MTEREILETRVNVMSMAVDIHRGNRHTLSEDLKDKRTVIEIYRELLSELLDGLSI